ncbi:MAG: hypothetical protein VX776_00800, partial [Planctomycetota bacterium]|nr:hypothetical protein [Planctomycetota bacterium]
NYNLVSSHPGNQNGKSRRATVASRGLLSREGELVERDFKALTLLSRCYEFCYGWRLVNGCGLRAVARGYGDSPATGPQSLLFSKEFRRSLPGLWHDNFLGLFDGW